MPQSTPRGREREIEYQRDKIAYVQNKAKDVHRAKKVTEATVQDLQRQVSDGCIHSGA